MFWTEAEQRGGGRRFIHNLLWVSGTGEEPEGERLRGREVGPRESHLEGKSPPPHTNHPCLLSAHQWAKQVRSVRLSSEQACEGGASVTSLLQMKDPRLRGEKGLVWGHTASQWVTWGSLCRVCRMPTWPLFTHLIKSICAAPGPGSSGQRRKQKLLMGAHDPLAHGQHCQLPPSKAKARIPGVADPGTTCPLCRLLPLQLQ